MIKQLFISPSCKISPINRFIYNWYSYYSTNNKSRKSSKGKKLPTTTTTTTTTTTSSSSSLSNHSSSIIDPIDSISYEQFRKSIIKNDIKHNHWNPLKKLSRSEMNKLKELKQYFPHFTTADLGKIFHISPESVRRILKSKYIPND